MKGNSPWLLAAASAVVTAIGGIIAWGQLGPVKVPRSGEWAHVVSVCPDDDVDAATYAEAMVLLQDHKMPVRVEDGPCDATQAIHVRVSPTDVERVAPSTETMGAYAEIEGNVAMGAAETRVVSGIVLDAKVWLRTGDDTAALVHEVLHGLGYDHPRNAPSGHVMHPQYLRMGLKDWRGVR